MREYWPIGQRLLADDAAHRCFSEHAQALALLAGALPPDRIKSAVDALTAPNLELTQASIYFQHYVFEALHVAGQGQAIWRRLDFWKGLADRGFATPPEKDDPTRSDCHAWGSHPLFHVHASLAGVRPASPGYREVRIKPTPGPLRHLSSQTPHPRGRITLNLSIRSDGSGSAEIGLPDQTPGKFHWAEKTYELLPGFRGTIDF